MVIVHVEVKKGALSLRGYTDLYLTRSMRKPFFIQIIRCSPNATLGKLLKTFTTQTEIPTYIVREANPLEHVL